MTEHIVASKLLDFVLKLSQVITFIFVIFLWMDFSFATPAKNRLSLSKRVDSLTVMLETQQRQNDAINMRLQWLIRVNCANLPDRQREAIYVCER